MGRQGKLCKRDRDSGRGGCARLPCCRLIRLYDLQSGVLIHWSEHLRWPAPRRAGDDSGRRTDHQQRNEQQTAARTIAATQLFVHRGALFLPPRLPWRLRFMTATSMEGGLFQEAGECLLDPLPACVPGAGGCVIAPGFSERTGTPADMEHGLKRHHHLGELNLAGVSGRTEPSPLPRAQLRTSARTK